METKREGAADEITLDPEKFKKDANNRIVYRADGGVDNVAWAFLIVVQVFLAFTFYLVIVCVVWGVLVAAGVIGYGIDAVDDAQNAAASAAQTYFRGSNPIA